MKRNVLYSILFLTILLLYFFTFNFFSSHEAVSTFKQYSSPSYKLTKGLIHTFLFEESIADKDKIEHNIKKVILNNLSYRQWEEYIDYIELKLYLENIIPGPTKQLIAVLNLSKDIATIVIFEEAKDQYIYMDKLENLLKIKDIEFLKPNMMIVHQEIDEYFGAFFYKEFLEIYLYNKDGFKNVWEQTIYFEEIYKEQWINPNYEDNRWNKVIEKTKVSFDQTHPLTISTHTEQFKYYTYSDDLPNKEDFSLETKKNFKQIYYWSNKYNCFIMGEVSKDRFLKDLGLVRDMNTSIECLFGIPNYNLRVISSNGDITYLNKSKFHSLFDDNK